MLIKFLLKIAKKLGNNPGPTTNVGVDKRRSGTNVGVLKRRSGHCLSET